MVFRSIVYKNRNIKKNRLYSGQTREKMYQNYLTNFLSIENSFQGSRKISWTR